LIHRLLTVALLGMAFMLLTSLTGCASREGSDARSVRKHPSPESNSIAFTRGQRKNNYAYTDNIRNRSFTDDWDRLWLMDRPTTLSHYPVRFE
jgi:hypothetical protein